MFIIPAMVGISNYAKLYHGDLFSDKLDKLSLDLFLEEDENGCKKDVDFRNKFYCSSCYSFFDESHFKSHKNSIADILLYERNVSHGLYAGECHIDTQNLFKDGKYTVPGFSFVSKLFDYILNVNKDELSIKLREFSISILEDVDFDINTNDYQYIKWYLCTSKRIKMCEYVLNQVFQIKFNFESIYDFIVEIIHGEEKCFKLNLYSLKKTQEQLIEIERRKRDEKRAIAKNKLEQVRPSDRIRIFERDNYTCQICRRSSLEDKVKLELDHIIPRAKGGLNCIDNYQTLCWECNVGKSDMILK